MVYGSAVFHKTIRSTKRYVTRPAGLDFRNERNNRIQEQYLLPLRLFFPDPDSADFNHELSQAYGNE